MTEPAECHQALVKTGEHTGVELFVEHPGDGSVNIRVTGVGSVAATTLDADQRLCLTRYLEKL